MCLYVCVQGYVRLYVCVYVFTYVRTLCSGGCGCGERQKVKVREKEVDRGLRTVTMEDPVPYPHLLKGVVVGKLSH